MAGRTTGPLGPKRGAGHGVQAPPNTRAAASTAWQTGSKRLRGRVLPTFRRVGEADVVAPAALAGHTGAKGAHLALQWLAATGVGGWRPAGMAATACCGAARQLPLPKHSCWAGNSASYPAFLLLAAELASAGAQAVAAVQHCCCGDCCRWRRCCCCRPPTAGRRTLNHTRSSVMSVIRATGVWKMEAISLQRVGGSTHGLCVQQWCSQAGMSGST